MSYPRPRRLPRAVLKAVEAVERVHIGQPLEYASVIDRRGRLLATRSGDVRRVELAGLEGHLANTTVTHNHPTGYGFSRDDLLFAVRHDLCELRAVGRLDGKEVLYRLQRPRSGWPTITDVQWQDAYARAWQGAQDQPAHLEAHRTMERVAERLGLRYSRIVRG